MIVKALMLVVICLEIHKIVMGDGDKECHDKTGGLEILLPVFSCMTSAILVPEGQVPVFS